MNLNDKANQFYRDRDRWINRQSVITYYAIAVIVVAAVIVCALVLPTFWEIGVRISRFILGS